VYIDLVGAPDGWDFETVQIKRIDLSFGKLVTVKGRLGYSLRDFLYYKKQDRKNMAKLVEIESEKDAENMIMDNHEECEVRLVLTRTKITDLTVNITPRKVPVGTTFYEDFSDENVYEYETWLAELREMGEGKGK
jgi:hypothetical protein